MEQWQAKLIQTWAHMMERCYSEPCVQYKDYGGRGIRVCDRWHDFGCYTKDIGPRPSGDMHLDRIDNSKGYSPENCRWVTRKENMNNRRNNVQIEIDGVTKNLQGWADEAGILPDTIQYRLKQGWTPKEAVFSKAYKQRSNNLVIEFQGRKGTCAEWSEWTGLPDTTIRNRLQLGWTTEKALTQPLRKHPHQKVARNAPR